MTCGRDDNGAHGDEARRWRLAECDRKGRLGGGSAPCALAAPSEQHGALCGADLAKRFGFSTSPKVQRKVKSFRRTQSDAKHSRFAAFGRRKVQRMAGKLWVAQPDASITSLAP